MDKDIAIKVENVSKTFKIPHEKVSSLRGAAVSLFSKNRGYEEFKALDDVSFEVKKGEFFGIIGRNGSGKSTLLKILAGIYQPDKGKVEINGRISPFLELGIGFNPELSGRDNVYLNATVLGLTKKEIDEKFDSIVKFSELERFIDQKLKNYSSGMQVRLAFSVSIHANREILLMDEVLAVGDNNFQAKCLKEFHKYREIGRTVVIVTHDISIIQRYCDRAMLIRNGNIKEIGKAEDVTNKYVFNNISDEEKRISNERKNDQFNGANLKKRAKITKVEFLDKDGNMKNIFMTNETIIVKIFFETDIDLDEINFGVGLHSTTGVFVFGYNTQMDNYSVGKNTNNLTLHLKDIPLLNGEYFVNVTMYGEFPENVYDLKTKCGSFQMFSLEKFNSYAGLLSVEHEWR